MGKKLFICINKINNMKEKLGSQRKFKHNLGSVIVGTICKRPCKSIYVVVNTYITPHTTLNESVDKIRRRIKANMSVIGPTYFDNLSN